MNPVRIVDLDSAAAALLEALTGPHRRPHAGPGVRSRVLAAVGAADLSAEQHEVVLWRFGLRDGRPRTLEETAAIVGGDRTEVRRAESRAMRHLRAAPEIRQLSRS